MLDGYLDAADDAPAPDEVLVKLEPGAWVAAGVALALIARLNATGARIAIGAADPAARALLGSAPGALHDTPRTRARLATREPSPRHGCVLAILPVEERPPAADDATAAGRAIVGVAAPGTIPPHGWLTALTPHDALRIALGDRSGAALARAASAVEAWLRAVASASARAPDRIRVSPLGLSPLPKRARE